MRRMSCGQLGLMLTLAGLAAFAFVAARWYLGNDTVPLFDSVAWRVVNADDAQILWQKDTSCLIDTPTIPNGALAVVGTQVVFHQFCLPPIAVLKAVDLTTGVQVWWATAPSSSQILSVGDGVINLADQTTLIKYDLAGQEVWRVGDFPAQSIQRIALQNDRLMVVQATGITVLSAQNGQRLEQMEEEIASADQSLPENIREMMRTQTGSASLVMGEYAYLYTSTNSLQIYNLQTDALMTTIQLERAGGHTGSIHLAGASNLVVIAYPTTHEIIALRLDNIPLADQ